MFESVQLLLNSGSFINKTNKFGQNALAMHIAQCNPRSKQVAMLLFAGGEKLGNNKLLGHVGVPKYLQQPDVCLKHLCREAIRAHLHPATATSLRHRSQISSIVLVLYCYTKRLRLQPAVAGELLC